MTEEEFLKRFDEHLERTGAILASVDRELALTREEVRHSREAYEDQRTFVRDLTVRNEKVWREVMNRLEDMGQEMRAQTAGLLSVLDRLEGTA